jgi:hypothetical protein
VERRMQSEFHLPWAHSVVCVIHSALPPLSGSVPISLGVPVSLCFVLEFLLPWHYYCSIGPFSVCGDVPTLFGSFLSRLHLSCLAALVPLEHFHSVCVVLVVLSFQTRPLPLLLLPPLLPGQRGVLGLQLIPGVRAECSEESFTE